MGNVKKVEKPILNPPRSDDKVHKAESAASKVAQSALPNLPEAMKGQLRALVDHAHSARGWSGYSFSSHIEAYFKEGAEGAALLKEGKFFVSALHCAFGDKDMREKIKSIYKEQIEGSNFQDTVTEKINTNMQAVFSKYAGIIPEDQRERQIKEFCTKHKLNPAGVKGLMQPGQWSELLRSFYHHPHWANQ
ncbi:MAG: hypothetical protein FJZ63_06700 [Chlamydiae bacterium]|nr:hypothetical protein [Chlamydiota bacterium]